MTITGTGRVIKRLPDIWRKFSGNNHSPGKSLILLILIFIFSCNSQNHYRRKIEQLSAGEDNYLVAASIGEYFHLFPGDVKQLTLYAEILLQYGYFDECIDLCDNILKSDRKNWHIYYTRAIAFSNIWEFSKSIRDFDTLFTLVTPGEEIIDQYQSAKLYNNIYLKILSVDTLIAEYPENAGFYFQRANLYLNMNEPLPATADYQYCLDLAGFNPDVVYNKFRAEMLSKDYVQARQDIERIRSEASVVNLLDPDYLTKMIDDAEKYEEVIKKNPDDITGFMEMARIFTFLKIENKAIEYLKSAQKMQPDNEQIQYRMAVVYALAGKTDRARQLVTELEKSGFKIPDPLKEMLE